MSLPLLVLGWIYQLVALSFLGSRGQGLPFSDSHLGVGCSVLVLARYRRWLARFIDFRGHSYSLRSATE